MDHRKSYVFLLIIWCICSLSHGTKENQPMIIQSLNIDCRITSRFARTIIKTELQNQLNMSREAVFDVELPKTAFITNFSMTVDSVTTIGTVKEKAEAKMQYQKAVSKGQSAGLVQSTGRKMEHFKITVNVAAFANAIFVLTYEELLKRSLGNYELAFKVKPKQLVENFQINAHVTEPQGIRFLEAHGTFITNELTDVVHINRTENQAQITFKPTMDQQRTCPECTETLLDGDFLIKYDVKRENVAGNIQISNGYFVHYFAPASLQKVPKNVVFVIDHSGSMHGQKIKQTYEAFLKILADLPEEDHFGILIFDDKVDKWQNTLVKAVPDNIIKAKQFVSKISARGGTDINKALLAAVKMLKNTSRNKLLPKISTSIILFLSDGEPTSGVTNHNEIINNVKKANERQTTLYCLGFGNDVDFNFLEKMALENGGLARRIYEDSDAALQLQGFYNEVANPLLLNVQLQYLDHSVGDVTQNNFRHYYQGSEIVVAGHINNDNLECLITGQGVEEQFSVNVQTNITEVEEATKELQYIFGDFTERLWAYLTIEQLLTQQISAQGEDKEKISKKALELSLKYNFVTPITSMVVTAPEDTDENKELIANKPKEGDLDNTRLRMGSLIRKRVIQKAPNYRKAISHRLHLDLHYYVYSDFDHQRLDHQPALLNEYTIPIQATHIPVHVLTPSPTFEPQITMIYSSWNMCFKISDAQNEILNLLHDEIAGITLNGVMTKDHKFNRFGIMNRKSNVKVDVSLENITVTHGEDVKMHLWTSSFQDDGFVSLNGEKLTVSLDRNVLIVISHKIQYLPFVVQNNLVLNDISGQIGPLLEDVELHESRSEIVVQGKHFQGKREMFCSVASSGKLCGSCWEVIIRSNELTNGTSSFVSDIFDSPRKKPIESN
uniref:Inter-alpha-trypsin inhibitor heavy chain family member 4 n=1 Tax=Xenopus tropicalis TaxID=8364 RepID=A0A6I8SSC0_XENTR